jgi:hypothetical protein
MRRQNPRRIACQESGQHRNPTRRQAARQGGRHPNDRPGEDILHHHVKRTLDAAPTL